MARLIRHAHMTTQIDCFEIYTTNCHLASFGNAAICEQHGKLETPDVRQMIRRRIQGAALMSSELGFFPFR